MILQMSSPIKSGMSVMSVISCGHNVFGMNQIRNIRNLMRIYCFGIDFIFVTVFIFAEMVTGSFTASAMTASIPPSSVRVTSETMSLSQQSTLPLPGQHFGYVRNHMLVRFKFGLTAKQRWGSSSNSPRVPPRRILLRLLDTWAQRLLPGSQILGMSVVLVVILGSLFWGIDSSPTGQFNPTVGACTPQFLPIGGLPCICLVRWFGAVLSALHNI